MSDALGHLECRICGRSIYFPVSESNPEDGGSLVELTCSKGHTDRYLERQTRKSEMEAALPLRAERTRAAAAVGF